MKKKYQGDLGALGARLRQIRQQGGHSNQVTFARQMGTSVKTVSLYETGKRAPNALFLRKICTDFHVNPTWLLTGEGSMRGRVKQKSLFEQT